MPDLTIKGIAGMLATQANAAAASARRALDFSPGGILRALAEGFAALALWLQAELLKVLSATRLATSAGADADSFTGDFGMARRAATAATGDALLSRTDATMAAFVPAGVLLRTGDGLTTFVVVADASRAAWDAAAGGYRIPAGTASLAVPVQAVEPGTTGNIGAGTLTLFATAIPGVDAVTNAASFSGGAPAETDAELRARFPAFLEALRQGTEAAVLYALGQALPGVFVRVVRNEDAAGGFRGGHFLVIVDDGTNAPPLAAAQAAVEPVRGLGITFDVLAADALMANVAMSLTVSPGASLPAAQAAAAAAVRGFIAANRGARLPHSRLAQLAYAADPNIVNVAGVLLNGGVADLVPTARQVVRAGTVAVG